MLDQTHNGKFFVPDACARTASVQVKDSATTATYIGKGELVFTDDFGTVLTTAAALKSVPAINLRFRGLNGAFDKFARIEGKNIVGYRGVNYVAPVQLTTYVAVTDFAKTNHSYVMHISEDGATMPAPKFEPVTITTGATAYTKKALIDAFVAAINLRFDTANRDEDLIKLTAENITDTHIKIEAKDYSQYDALTFRRNTVVYTVQVLDDWGTVTSNRSDALIAPEAVDKYTRGIGDARDVAEMELLAKAQGNVVYQDFSGKVPRTRTYNVNLDETYDYIHIELSTPIAVNEIGKSVNRQLISIALPITDNATSQVGATNGIVPVLNKYCVTEWGVGTAFTIS